MSDGTLSKCGDKMTDKMWHDTEIVSPNLKDEETILFAASNFAYESLFGDVWFVLWCQTQTQGWGISVVTM